MRYLLLVQVVVVFFVIFVSDCEAMTNVFGRTKKAGYQRLDGTNPDHDQPTDGPGTNSGPGKTTSGKSSTPLVRKSSLPDMGRRTSPPLEPRRTKSHEEINPVGPRKGSDPDLNDLNLEEFIPEEKRFLTQLSFLHEDDESRVQPHALISGSKTFLSATFKVGFSPTWGDTTHNVDYLQHIRFTCYVM